MNQDPHKIKDIQAQFKKKKKKLRNEVKKAFSLHQGASSFFFAYGIKIKIKKG
jgi:hypothetical protein